MAASVYTLASFPHLSLTGKIWGYVNVTPLPSSFPPATRTKPPTAPSVTSGHHLATTDGAGKSRDEYQRRNGVGAGLVRYSHQSFRCPHDFTRLPVGIARVTLTNQDSRMK
ncbi:hypothetical protein Pcinc_018668 [Petrolisthes cinctipes]|uniref:Uncharacterized protein n=1 Tax=Petrolisthes cinctipes TaxID=88211 RepID=A0AAE1FLR3_PETCI|nr:hypothetical protein Pcinc_018668 [Petrolisthes cinctipes]